MVWYILLCGKIDVIREQGGLTLEDKNPVRPMIFFCLIYILTSENVVDTVNLLREASKPVLISMPP